MLQATGHHRSIRVALGPILVVLTVLFVIPAAAFEAPASAIDQRTGASTGESTGDDEQAKKKPPIEKVTIRGREFKLVLAATEPSRAQGLAGVKEIPADGGMLFVFTRSRILSFWMKGCVVDMDLIQLDARGTIVSIHHMKPDPPRKSNESETDYERRLKRYPSPKACRFAIELKAGKAKELKLKVGETIALERGRLIRLAS